MIVVDSKSDNVLAPGQLLSVFGAFFDDDCQVLFNGDAGTIDDVTDGCIVAVCPFILGSYSVTVVSAGRSYDVGVIDVRELADVPQEGALPAYRMRDWCYLVASFFPRGRAFDLRYDTREASAVSLSARLTGSVFGLLIWAVAYALSLVWGLMRMLVVALDPGHTQNLAEWENDYGLPLAGTVDLSDTARRSEVYRAACTPGGCTKPYFLKMLRLLGIDADVYEYYKDAAEFSVTTTEYTYDEDAGTTSWENVTYAYSFPSGADRNFYFKVNIHCSSVDISYLSCIGTCVSPLAEWRNFAVENLINKIKPAHCVAIFGYDDGVRRGYILDENGKRLTDENGRPLTYENHLW